MLLNTIKNVNSVSNKESRTEYKSYQAKRMEVFLKESLRKNSQKV